ncbi:MAG: 1,4-alpha-glucan branching protein domain-containing protein [Bradymonadia bacterium]
MSATTVLITHHHLPAISRDHVGQRPEGCWVLQYVLHTALPLLQVTEGLVADGVPFTLGAAFTPTLLWQLSDPNLPQAFRPWLAVQKAAHEAIQAACVDASLQPALDAWSRHLERLGALFEKLDGDILGAFVDLHRRGHLELLVVPASHGILPLTGLVPLQLQAGLTAIERTFGRRPKGLWVPEGAISPQLTVEAAALGFTHALVEPEALGGAPTLRDTAGQSTLLYISRDAGFAQSPKATDAAYPGAYGLQVDDPATRALPNGVAMGYARLHTGDRLGAPLWARGDGSFIKQPYDPEAAVAAAQAHADSWARHQSEQHRVGAIDATAITDRWLEGPAFLDHLYRHGGVAWGTLEAVAEQSTPLADRSPQLYSRGPQGDLQWWCDTAHHWLTPRVQGLARRLSALTGTIKSNQGKAALAQGARAWLLAAASDWPALMSAERWVDVALSNVRAHLHACARICEMLEGSDGLFEEVDRTWLTMYSAQWSLWPDLDLEVITPQTPASLEPAPQAPPGPMAHAEDDHPLRLKPGEFV